jgi:hypothetical protein
MMVVKQGDLLGGMGASDLASDNSRIAWGRSEDRPLSPYLNSRILPRFATSLPVLAGCAITSRRVTVRVEVALANDAE